MTELTFTKPEGYDYYQADATVNADWNLHLERVKPESVVVEVTTVNGTKKQTKYNSKEGEVFDEDFDGIVYPKYITIKSWSLPTKGYITEAE